MSVKSLGWSVTDKFYEFYRTTDQDERRQGFLDPGLPVSEAGLFRGPREIPQKVAPKKPHRPRKISEGGREPSLGGVPGQGF